MVGATMESIGQDIVGWSWKVAEDEETHFPKRRGHLNQTGQNSRTTSHSRFNLERRPMGQRQTISSFLKHSVVASEAEISRSRRRRRRSATPSRRLYSMALDPALRYCVNTSFLFLPAPRTGGLAVIARNFTCSARIASLRVPIKSTKQRRITFHGAIHLRQLC